MRDHTFSRLVDRIVLGVAGCALGACGGLADEEVEPLACVDDATWPGSGAPADTGSAADWLGAVEPALSFDAMEMWRGAPISGVPVRGGELLYRRGELCAAALDRAACDMAIDGLVTTTEGFVFGDRALGNVLVATRGDEVILIESAGGVQAWLGPIDTPVEAAWAVRLLGYEIRCGELQGQFVEEGYQWGVRERGDGWEVLALRLISDCTPYEKAIYLLGVSPRGKVTMIDQETAFSDANMCAGRRPGGWQPERGGGATPVGRHLARMAELESASVAAFRHIEDELRHHRAPASLRREARKARADEVRHALTTRRLARRAGAAPQRPTIAVRLPPRDLRALALDNAREGCAREAYGAVVARWQSVHAADPRVRTPMERIARDEGRHAAFSLRLDRWLRSRLTPEERDAVARERRAAFEELRREIAAPPAPELVASLGLPAPPAARALLDALVATLA